MTQIYNIVMLTSMKSDCVAEKLQALSLKAQMALCVCITVAS